MICNYDNADNERHMERCPKCFTGIMILVGIIGGIIFASITVVLFIFSLINGAIIGVITALITALVFLFILLITLFVTDCHSRVKTCIRCNLGGLFFGIFGTVFSAFLAVSTLLISISIPAIILIGLTAFFFAFMIISTLFLAICVSKC